ncbi:enoyl-CoA hydratase-related protein [uncultured Jatrophihabitans sp.]|uniref:enoyl-CoA hydratase-related protein n=1 Tax=uncultured Jatrophihabitans sp. TaxID=1610747 RepID=UPI0035C9789A
MQISAELDDAGVYTVTIEAPPVNAFSIALLAELTAVLGDVPDDARVVLLRSVGRGFCGGGDVKEVQRLEAFEGILGQARRGLDACVAVEQCPVPVVAAVHGYCIGIGVLVVGVCDIVLAAEGTTFVLAEADNGAASGVVQALGLLPEKRMRSAMFTCEPFFPDELQAYGSVHRVTSPEALPAAARETALTVAAKSPRVVRALKQSMNRNLGRDLIARYRAELSYTYELNMTGDARAARGTFVDGARGSYAPAGHDEAP